MNLHSTRSVQHDQIQRLLKQKDILFNEHNQKIQDLELKYSHYIQQLMNKKSELHRQLNKLYYQRLNAMNEEILLLYTGNNTQNISNNNNSNQWLLSSPIQINNNDDNSNNSVSATTTTIQSICSSQNNHISSSISSIKTDNNNTFKLYENQNNNNNNYSDNYSDNDTSSVSSDESVTSSEDESSSQTLDILNNISNRINNNSNNMLKQRRNSMDIDDDSDTDDDDDDDDVDYNKFARNQMHQIPHISNLSVKPHLFQENTNKNQENNSNSNRKQENIEYDIGSNDWLFEYIENKENKRNYQFSSNETQTIILNMNKFSNTDKIRNDAISQTLEKMKMCGLFEQCQNIQIISPSKIICKNLHELIGKLSSIQSAEFNGMSFFPMIKMVNKMHSKQFKYLNLSNIEIIHSCYPEITDEYVDEIEINQCVGTILSCNKLTISKWKNQHRFWNQYIAKFVRKFTHSQSEINGELRDKLEKCNIKCLEYYGGDPKQDDVPHSMMKLFLKFFASQLEIFNVDFVNKNLYHSCMPWMYQKTINENLNFKSLKQICFTLRDDRSINLLKIVIKTSNNIKKIKLILPNNKKLDKKEENIIKSLEKKVTVERCTMQ